MQIKDLTNLGVSKKTIDEQYVDFGQLICSDEFGKKQPSNKNYRERAIERLIESKCSFSSNLNILYDLMKKYVKVECPHCQEIMAVKSGSFYIPISTTTYQCNKCNAKISLTLPPDGFSVIGERD